MDNRILKDIRYYESKPDDYLGKFDGMLGNIYQNSPDTKYIGQRIARKLNEFGFISGDFDHIYINLSTKLNENEITESNVILDKRVKYFNCGVSNTVFNSMTDFEKDEKIKDISFKVLSWIYNEDDLNIKLINEVKSLIDKNDKHLKISYKTKETSNYLIDLSYQIRPDIDTSKLIVDYSDKKEKSNYQVAVEILDYEDLYSLIDNVTIKDGFIVFQPKKSYLAELVAKKYKNPLIKIEINKMTKQ